MITTTATGVSSYAVSSTSSTDDRSTTTTASYQRDSKDSAGASNVAASQAFTGHFKDVGSVLEAENPMQRAQQRKSFADASKLEEENRRLREELKEMKRLLEKSKNVAAKSSGAGGGGEDVEENPWQVYQDSDGRNYYYNVLTQACQYEQPANDKV